MVDYSQTRITSFRTRTSKLTPGQTKKWTQNWVQYGYQISSDQPAAQQTKEAPTQWQPSQWINQVSPLIMEIGCGTGTATVQMAKAHPEENIIAVDVYKPGLAYLFGEIAAAGLTNIRVAYGDAIQLLTDFPDNSLDAIRLFFPDPWPKKRHHKRRIIRPENLTIFTDKLKPNGILHFASDHAEYAEAVVEIITDFPRLEQVKPGDLPANSVNISRPETKFESKGKTKGHHIVDIIWEKKQIDGEKLV